MSDHGSARRARIGGAIRRNGSSAMWTATDQILSALSNFAVGVAVARAGSAELGRFTIAFTIWLIAQNLHRSLVSEPLMTVAIEEDPKVSDRSALTSTVAFAAVSGITVLAVGLALHSGLLVALAVVLPGVLIQDFYRFQAFRWRAARRAASLDIVWVVILLPLLPVIVRVGTAEAGVLVWGVGAAVAAVVGAIRARVRPAAHSEAWQWWLAVARRYGILLAVDNIVVTVSLQVTTFLLVATLGLSDVGRLRAAQMLIGPATTGFVAFNVFVLPRLVSRRDEMTARGAVGMSAACVGFALVILGGSVIAGPILAQVFFGSPLGSDFALLAPLALAFVIFSATTGFSLQMKAVRRVGAQTVVRVVISLVGIPLVVITSAAAGLYAAVGAVVVKDTLLTLGTIGAWWFSVHRPRRRASGAAEAAAQEPAVDADVPRQLAADRAAP